MINPYSNCVVSKIIEEKKCTIVWYVDDNNALHVNLKLIENLISALKVHFGDLVITRGKNTPFWI